MSLKSGEVVQGYGRFGDFDFTISYHSGSNLVEIRHSRGLMNAVYEKIEIDDDGFSTYHTVTTKWLRSEALARGFVIVNLDGLTEAILKIYKSLEKTKR